jgi:hypothetical protein
VGALFSLSPAPPPSPAPTSRLHRRPHAPLASCFCLRPPMRRASTVARTRLHSRHRPRRLRSERPPLRRTSTVAHTCLRSRWCRAFTVARAHPSGSARRPHVATELGAAVRRAHRFDRLHRCPISRAPREGNGESVSYISTFGWRLFLHIFKVFEHHYQFGLELA